MACPPVPDILCSANVEDVMSFKVQNIVDTAFLWQQVLFPIRQVVEPKRVNHSSFCACASTNSSKGILAIN
jgi:hypothetical protein